MSEGTVSLAAVQRAALRRGVVDDGVAAEHFVLAGSLEHARAVGERWGGEGEWWDGDGDEDDGRPTADGLLTATLACLLAVHETEVPSPMAVGVPPDPERHRLLLDGALLAHRRLDVSLADAASAAGVRERELRAHREVAGSD